MQTWSDSKESWACQFVQGPLFNKFSQIPELSLPWNYLIHERVYKLISFASCIVFLSIKLRFKSTRSYFWLELLLLCDIDLTLFYLGSVVSNYIPSNMSMYDLKLAQDRRNVLQNAIQLFTLTDAKCTMHKSRDTVSCQGQACRFCT